MYSPKVRIISIGVLSFFLLLCILTLSYETNDDVIMMFISSGTLTNNPSEYLVFINIIIGKLLKFLYNTFPTLNWYSYFMVFIHFISSTVILISYVYKKERLKIEIVAFMMVLYMGFVSLFLVKLQFTSTAFVCGIAGLLLLYSNVPTRLKIMSSLLLISISFLIRKDTFIPLIIFYLPYFILLFKTNTKKLKYVILLFSLITIYFFAMHINYNNKVYTLSNYYNYQHAADKLCNNPISVSDSILLKYNWEQNDFKIFTDWYWVNRNVFSDVKVINFSNSVEIVRSWNQFISETKNFIFNERFAVIILCFSVLSYLLFNDNDSVKKIIVSTNIFILIAFISYLLFTARLPKRVSTPLIYYSVMLNFFFINVKSNKKMKYFVLTSILFLFCIYKFYCVYDLSITNKEHQHKFTNAIKVINQYPDYLHIVISKSFPLEDIPVFIDCHHLLNKNNLQFTGWFINTPVYNYIYYLNGIKLIDSFILNKNKIFYINNEKEFGDHLAVYFKKHFDATIKNVPAYEKNAQLKKYRVVFN